MRAQHFSRRWPPVALALAALALGFTVYWWRPTTPPPQISGYVLPEPRPLPNVALVDDAGASFAPADFAGHWSFLFFGYTYCPDVCPLTLVELANLKALLAAQLPDEATAYYLVSVDPGRDTPARLREYVAYFDPAFRGLTGSLDALHELAQSVGSVFFVPEGQASDAYLVSHSSSIVLLAPDGKQYAVFTAPHDPARLAADFAAIAAYRDERS